MSVFKRRFQKPLCGNILQLAPAAGADKSHPQWWWVFIALQVFGRQHEERTHSLQDIQPGAPLQGHVPCRRWNRRAHHVPCGPHGGARGGWSACNFELTQRAIFSVARPQSGRCRTAPCQCCYYARAVGNGRISPRSRHPLPQHRLKRYFKTPQTC